MCMGGLDWDDLEEQETRARCGTVGKLLELVPLGVLSCFAPRSSCAVAEEQCGQVCAALAGSGADVMCVQGLWASEDERLRELYECKLGALGLKHEEALDAKEGAAVLWRVGSMRVSLKGELRAHGSPRDCASLLLVLRDVRTDEFGPRVAVVCANFGGQLGEGRSHTMQLQELLQALTTNLAHIPAVPVLLCACGLSPEGGVQALLMDFGFMSVLEPVPQQARPDPSSTGTECMWIRGCLQPASVKLWPDVDTEGRASSGHFALLGTFEWLEH
mmetsp:Transcript_5912/g.14023  ORF Transcript_5912/g.14023 Transcript_5912/m.14023 type:complete len:274 (-) Transcript_5912:137-958(-)|eukprot:CAMPEP_0171100082 /NCGR_PEP_ID=MMETSP0766_2-20121228/52741_1 /TAXON_ID=439317 /ORGANISM="Gambierdiscus australes, Strain CAWD 149" /LENGTH=273 /DNA_ID=CAMNT_0011559835 /DNA_START=59 /DNA_END=880 /DNA_ORIENTATION=+